MPKGFRMPNRMKEGKCCNLNFAAFYWWLPKDTKFKMKKEMYKLFIELNIICS